MAEKVNLTDLDAAIGDILDDYSEQMFDVRQKAIQAGAEVLVKALEQATPRDTGEMAHSWKIKKEYPNHRYVGNTETAKGVVHRKKKGGGKGEARADVPLSQVLEYGENTKHYGFIRKCFDATEPQIFAAIKNTLNNGGN